MANVDPSHRRTADKIAEVIRQVKERQALPIIPMPPTFADVSREQIARALDVEREGGAA